MRPYPLREGYLILLRSLRSLRLSSSVRAFDIRLFMEAIRLFYKMVKGEEPSVSELNNLRPKGIAARFEVQMGKRGDAPLISRHTNRLQHTADRCNRCSFRAMQGSIRIVLGSSLWR